MATEVRRPIGQQPSKDEDIYRRATTTQAQAALIDELRRLQQSTEDRVIQGGNLRADALLYEGGTDREFWDTYATIGLSRDLNITSFAHTQLAEKANIPLDYYRRMHNQHPVLWKQSVNEWMNHDRHDDTFLVRSIGNDMRALLTSRTKILDSYDLFFHVFKVADAVGAQVWKMSLSPTKFYMELIHPSWAININDDDGRPHNIQHMADPHGGMHVPGLLVGNSDVGRGALTVTPRIVRWVCNNGTMAGDDFRRIHLGSDLPVGIISAETKRLESELIWSEVEDVVRNVFDLDKFRALMHNYASGRDIKVMDVEASIDQVVRDTSMTEEYRNNLMKAFIEGGDISAFGLMQAATQSAQLLADLDQQYSIERYAHSVLVSESKQSQLVSVS